MYKLYPIWGVTKLNAALAHIELSVISKSNIWRKWVQGCRVYLDNDGHQKEKRQSDYGPLHIFMSKYHVQDWKSIQLGKSNKKARSNRLFV